MKLLVSMYAFLLCCNCSGICCGKTYPIIDDISKAYSIFKKDSKIEIKPIEIVIDDTVKAKVETFQSSSSYIIDPANWRGVNLPLRIGEKIKTQLDQEIFYYAANAGANVVRLNAYIDSNFSFLSNPNSTTEVEHMPFIINIKKAVSMAEKAHIKIILDMHHNPGTKEAKIWTDKKYWDVYINLWSIIAGAFKNDTTIIAYDLMNEPGIKAVFTAGDGDVARMFKGTWQMPDSWKGTTKDYFLLMSNLIKKIREVDKNKWMIVEGFGYLGNPINFHWMQPITGFDKIAYSFHMYVPTGFTMLGTRGSNKKGKGENVKPFLATDEKKIDNAFAPVLAFQKKYNVPIFVGEFGITDKTVFESDANGQKYNGACWLATVVNKMNQNGWGWTYWDFWTKIRKPKSNDDPRYQILSAAMKGQTIKDYCK